MSPFPTVMADEAVIIETIDVGFIVYCIPVSLLIFYEYVHSALYLYLYLPFSFDANVFRLC